MPPSPDTLPNYHFLLIAPNLGAEWLFDAARAYYERFRPIAVSDLELIKLIPPQFTVAVTVIARRDTAAQWGVQLAQNAPNALFDAVVYDSFDDTRAVLTSRAASNQPFGVPLLPTATPPPALSPTPGALIGGPQPLPTRPSGGFVTQTPTPGSEGQQPITPTPGSLIGG
jgi:hypothetical protein